MIGSSITWTNAGSYYYNTTANIYLYPVVSVSQVKFEREYDLCLTTEENKFIENNGVLIVDFSLEYPVNEISINSGSCFVVPLSSDLVGVEINKVGVK